MLRFLINTYEGLSFQKLFKTGSCVSPKHEVPDIYLKSLNTSLWFFYKHTYAKIDNAGFFIKIFNWVTLSTIPWASNIWPSFNLHHVVHLLYAKMCSFAHIRNESNLKFPWHVKNLAYTGKNKSNKEKNKTEDAKFYQIKTNLSE